MAAAAEQPPIEEVVVIGAGKQASKSLESM
jgi:hypothetical protein